MAPYCAIPRDYLSDTPLLRAMGFLVSQHGQWGAIPPSPLFSAFPPWRAREVEARYPRTKGVSQRYLRDTLAKQGKWVRYPPLRYYLERVLRDRGGGVSRIGLPSTGVWVSLGFASVCGKARTWLERRRWRTKVSLTLSISQKKPREGCNCRFPKKNCTEA